MSHFKFSFILRIDFPPQQILQVEKKPFDRKRYGNIQWCAILCGGFRWNYTKQINLIYWISDKLWSWRLFLVLINHGFSEQNQALLNRPLCWTLRIMKNKSIFSAILWCFSIGLSWIFFFCLFHWCSCLITVMMGKKSVYDDGLVDGWKKVKINNSDPDNVLSDLSSSEGFWEFSNFEKQMNEKSEEH